MDDELARGCYLRCFSYSVVQDHPEQHFNKKKNNKKNSQRRK